MSSQYDQEDFNVKSSRTANNKHSRNVGKKHIAEDEFRGMQKRKTHFKNYLHLALKQDVLEDALDFTADDVEE